MNATMQITVGAGLKVPRGNRLEVNSVAELARLLAVQKHSVEGWWAPHVWRDDTRDSDGWEGACCIGIDLDREGHADLVGEIAERLEVAAKASGLSGSIFHRTPAGARVIFVLDKACTDSEAFLAAAEGAAHAVSDDLRELSIDGVSVDPKPHHDLARLYFIPNTFAKGRQRQAEVITLRETTYSVQALSDMRPERRQAKASNVSRLPLPATSNVRRAAAYLAKMGPSIEGNRGDDHAFRVAATLVRDFALDDGEAWTLISDWNATCQPPWSEGDLRRFLRSAEKNGSGGVGRALLEQRPTSQAPRQASQPVTPAEPPASTEIPLIRACDAVEKPVEWVIENFLAKGELTDLSGDPGVGKGGITASWAARVTQNDPDATVIFFATEDPLGRVKARLRAEGADLARVLLLDITQPNASPILPGDIGQVENLVRKHKAALLILDPALEFMEASLDSHKQQDVARFMAPLLSIAQRTGAALLTVRHNNKNAGASALHRASGSIGFTGKVRIALTAAKNQETGGRALSVAKNNLGSDRFTVAYDIVTKDKSSVIAWGEVLSISADELVTQEPAKKRGPAPARQEAAMDVLSSVLANGPMTIDDAVRCAKSEGFSRGTLYRAAAALGVQKCTLNMKSAWRLNGGGT